MSREWQRKTIDYFKMLGKLACVTVLGGIAMAVASACDGSLPPVRVGTGGFTVGTNGHAGCRDGEDRAFGRPLGYSGRGG